MFITQHKKLILKLIIKLYEKNHRLKHQMNPKYKICNTGIDQWVVGR